MFDCILLFISETRLDMLIAHYWFLKLAIVQLHPTSSHDPLTNIN